VLGPEVGHEVGFKEEGFEVGCAVGWIVVGDDDMVGDVDGVAVGIGQTGRFGVGLDVKRLGELVRFTEMDKSFSQFDPLDLFTKFPPI